MAAVIKEDGSLVETSFAVSMESIQRFSDALKKDDKPNDKLIELMRFKRESKKK